MNDGFVILKLPDDLNILHSLVDHSCDAIKHSVQMKSWAIFFYNNIKTFFSAELEGNFSANIAGMREWTHFGSEIETSWILNVYCICNKNVLQNLHSIKFYLNTSFFCDLYYWSHTSVEMPFFRPFYGTLVLAVGLKWFKWSWDYKDLSARVWETVASDSSKVAS